MQPRYLTKSKFKLAIECPTKLYYAGKKEYYNKKKDDDFLQALAEGGFQVGELAQCYYPDGVLVDTLDHQEALIKTNKLLQNDHVVIFEAAIEHKDCFIRIDVLEKKGNILNLYEVKSKSYSKDTNRNIPLMINSPINILRPWQEYLWDVAFQTWVLENKLPKYQVNPFLTLVDKTVIVDVDGLNQRFFLERDEKGHKYVIRDSETTSINQLGKKVLIDLPVRDQINLLLNEQGIKAEHQTTEFLKLFNQKVEDYSTYIKSDKKAPMPIGWWCDKCEFTKPENIIDKNLKDGFKECWGENLDWTDSEFVKPHVFEIWNTKKKSAMLNDKVYLQEQILQNNLMDAYSLNDRQMLQIEKCVDRDDFEDIKTDLFVEMENWNFPLHFIDFETCAPALPFNKGMKPYEKVIFQFSCHTVYDKGNGDYEVEHSAEWINTKPGYYPNIEFLKKLKKHLSKDDGSIFQYSHYENTCLNAVCQQLARPEFPDCSELIRWVSEIQESRPLVDLLVMVREYYYQRNMKGKNSIKNVLPTVMASSEFLQEKYANYQYNSNNFENKIWYEMDPDTGIVKDPYSTLGSIAEDINYDKAERLFNKDEIREGGATMTAYSKMQFTQMTNAERKSIRKALLKYCELDTLAMVMIWEHWYDSLKNN